MNLSMQKLHAHLIIFASRHCMTSDLGQTAFAKYLGLLLRLPDRWVFPLRHCFMQIWRIFQLQVLTSNHAVLKPKPVMIKFEPNTSSAFSSYTRRLAQGFYYILLHAEWVLQINEEQWISQQRFCLYRLRSALSLQDTLGISALQSKQEEYSVVCFAASLLQCSFPIFYSL